jgi:hypothetical protein
MGDASGVGDVKEMTGGARREDEAPPIPAEAVSSWGGGGDGLRVRSGLEFDLA